MTERDSRNINDIGRHNQTGHRGMYSLILSDERKLRLSENWDSYRVFDWHREVPQTNNTTEQVIGRMKIRSRTVRGYKSWQGMWAAFLLTGSGLSW